MSRIEVNSAFGLGLERISEPVDVYDEHGRKLGKFVPHLVYDCPIPEEELERRAEFARANPGAGKPFSEILKRLEKQ